MVEAIGIAIAVMGFICRVWKLVRNRQHQGELALIKSENQAQIRRLEHQRAAEVLSLQQALAGIILFASVALIVTVLVAASRKSL